MPSTETVIIPAAEALTVTRKNAVFALHSGILADLQRPLQQAWRILDFGCGSGRSVYEYRDQGYDCVGTDILPSPIVRSPGDERLFTQAGASLNYPNNHFDFLFSTQVIEHVLDHRRAFQEMARVLKPGAVSLHIFPGSYRPIETHIRVPFGSLFGSWTYYYLWALLGVRSPSQQGKPAKQVAGLNYAYNQEHLNYPSQMALAKYCAPLFRTVSFAEAPFTRHASPGTWSARVSGAVSRSRIFNRLYSDLHTRCLFLVK